MCRSTSAVWIGLYTQKTNSLLWFTPLFWLICEVITLWIAPYSITTKIYQSYPITRAAKRTNRAMGKVVKFSHHRRRVWLCKTKVKTTCAPSLMSPPFQQDDYIYFCQNSLMTSQMNLCQEKISKTSTNSGLNQSPPKAGRLQLQPSNNFASWQRQSLRLLS